MQTHLENSLVKPADNSDTPDLFGLVEHQMHSHGVAAEVRVSHLWDNHSWGAHSCNYLSKYQNSLLQKSSEVHHTAKFAVALQKKPAYHHHENGVQDVES
jgi:hypothetical protein